MPSTAEGAAIPDRFSRRAARVLIVLAAALALMLPASAAAADPVDAADPARPSASPAPPSADQALRLDAGALGAQDSAVEWRIGLSTQALESAYAQAGEAVDFDGTTSQEIVLTAVLGAGQSLPQAADWSLRASGGGRDESVVLDDGAPGATTTDSGDFSLEVVPIGASEAGSQARIVIRGPFADDAEYEVLAPAPVSGPESRARAGLVYESSVAVEGARAQQRATVSLPAPQASPAQQEPGYGGVSLSAYASGPASDQVSPQTAFAVQLTYTLPEGTTAGSYPGWQPPGELNAEATGGVLTLQAPLSGPASLDGALPAGTTVSLHAPQSTAEAPVGYTWGAGAVRVAGQEATSLVIQEGRTIGIEVETALELAAMGTLSVQVTVGPQDSAFSADAFEIGYSCILPNGKVRSGLLEVQAGTAVESPEVQAGSLCTVSQSDSTRQRAGHAVDTHLTVDGVPSAGVVIAPQTTATVVVNNVYTARSSSQATAEPSSAPPAPATGTGQSQGAQASPSAGQARARQDGELARTGASIAVPAAAAALALVGGAVLVRRRKA
ncbi:DUF5979 domain-containing protein [Actinomyces slackii]|uniref:Gram-positive cocci surface proteins LPxTG domain-containing protein n=1 Tax=Actinomyces slackii TaxID=52774 RepID=A0A448K9D9_9ACTO|nr:DUF5979 domain-containing protein [Actinomyces slackii]VEG73536.1 Uncharacterised protein [Actinomyces slackii]